MPSLEANNLLKGPIVKGVGQKKSNLALDVALVQSLLNTIRSLPDIKSKVYKIAKPIIDPKLKNIKNLVVNGRYSQELVNEIKNFQGLYCNLEPDGAISAGKTTWKQLLKVSGVNLNKNNKIQVIFGSGFVKHTPTLLAVNKVDLKAYISKHLYIARANEKLTSFLDALLTDKTMTNVYWAAYYLATAYHETKYSFKAVIEDGKGSGKKYDKIIQVTDTYGYRGKKGLIYDNVFYGRGYVQITWDVSYKYISKKIGMRIDELYINPDKALETDIAYKILTYWMQNDIPKVKGLGRKIQEHITSHGTPNYITARKVVNGSDRATEIANYATVIEALIRLSATK